MSLLSVPGYIGQEMGVNVTIENLLDAYTDDRDTGLRSAFIEKKFASGAVSLTVSMVPEPSGVTLPKKCKCMVF